MHKTRKLVDVILIALVALSFLFSPKPVNKKDYHGERFEINRYMGFTINGNAWDFFAAAYSPSSLLQPKSPRQARPLFVLAGTVIGYPLHFVLKNFGVDWKQSFYFAFVILNFIALWCCVFVFFSGHKGYSILAGTALTIILISNPVTKAFVWTAHTQIFNILVPLMCVFAAESFAKQLPTIKRISITALLWGLLPLFYGSFILLYPAYYIGRVFYRNYKKIFQLVREMIFTGILFCLPTFLWIICCNVTAGSYYNFEAEVYRQFVWVHDAFGISFNQGATKMYDNALMFFETFRQTELIVLMVLFIFCFAADYNRGNYIFVWVSVLFLFFFYLLGFYQNRLTFNFVPILIYAVSSMQFNKLERMKIPLAVFALMWHIYEVVSYGPFS